MLSKKIRFHVLFLISILSLVAFTQDTVVTSQTQEPKQKATKVQDEVLTKPTQTLQQETLQLGVIILTEQTFDKRVKNSSKPWFIKIYAPWCGHCKRLAPTWDELAEKLQGKVNVAKVDATKQTDIAGRLDVRGYPTLLFTEDGKNFIQYKGPRTVENLQAFALKDYKFASDDQKSQISEGGKFAIFMLAIMRSFKELDKNIDAWLQEKGIISTATSGYLKIGVFLMIFIAPFICVGICSFFVFSKKDEDIADLTQEEDSKNKKSPKKKRE